MKTKALGTYEIAKICQVTPATIGNWIDKGILPTFTTGGGHRRVWIEDLLEFLKKHNIPVPEALKNQSNIKIMIVDDEPAIITTVKRILEAIFENAEIDSADNGFDAGQKIAIQKPDLIILDLKLPGMDGFQVCKLIKSNPALKHSKILAISGYNISEYSKKALESGADDFLPKPFNSEEIKEKISRLLEVAE